MAQSKEAVNAADSRGTTPLMYAASIGSADAIQLLLAAGADVNAANGLVFDTTLPTISWPRTSGSACFGAMAPLAYVRSV